MQSLIEFILIPHFWCLFILQITSDGCLFIYGIDERASFIIVEEFYRNAMRTKGELWLNSFGFPRVLVGNHCDRGSSREVSTQEGTQLARKLGCDFVEVSVEDDVSIGKAFYDAVRAIRRAQRQH